MDGLAGGGLGENLGNFIRVLPQSFSSRDEARAFMNAHCPDPSIAQYLMAVSRSEPSPSGLQIVFPFDSASLLQTIEAARGVSLKEWVNQAARAGIRVLALRGARSKVWSAEAFESDKRLFDPALPIQFEEIADAGHGLPFERRAAFIARLQSFIH
jgi:pimeloyl-ACP methyl ester carboxylesterase